MYTVMERLVEQVDSPEQYIVHKPEDMVAYTIAVASGYVRGDVITLAGMEWMEHYRHPVRRWFSSHWFTFIVAMATIIASVSGVIIEWMSQGFLGFIWGWLQ